MSCSPCSLLFFSLLVRVALVRHLRHLDEYVRSAVLRSRQDCHCGRIHQACTFAPSPSFSHCFSRASRSSWASRMPTRRRLTASARSSAAHSLASMRTPCCTSPSRRRTRRRSSKSAIASCACSTDTTAPTRPHSSSPACATMKRSPSSSWNITGTTETERLT